MSGSNEAQVRINHPTVVAETFDGERVIVHLGTGVYYALDPNGSSCWDLLERGTDRETLIHRWAEERGVAGDDAGTVIDEFLARLADEDLIVSSLRFEAPAQEPASPIRLQRFSDLADVLAVDPIHDLDLDGDGWPIDAAGGLGRPRPTTTDDGT